MINNIIGTNGKVAEQLHLMQIGEGNREKGHEFIEMYIYNTLAKYIIQMLRASIGTTFYADLVPLPKHIRDYF